MPLRIVNFNYFLTAVNAAFLYNRPNYVIKVNHYLTTFWVVKKQLRALYNRPQDTAYCSMPHILQESGVQKHPL